MGFFNEASDFFSDLLDNVGDLVNFIRRKLNPHRPIELSGQELANGVAAGDVTDDSVVLWARPNESGTVRFEVSLDPSFRSVIRRTLCRDTLSILFANREGRRILSLRDGLGCSGTRLLVHDRRLRAFIQSSSRAAPDPTSRPLTAAVLRPSGASAWRVSVSLLPRSAAGMNGSELPCLALTVIDPESDAVPRERDLHAIYGLTLAEARVAARLCAGDLHEVARDLGITYNTAKSHLRIIFDKVGVSRQSALVRRITLDLAS